MKNFKYVAILLSMLSFASCNSTSESDEVKSINKAPKEMTSTEQVTVDSLNKELDKSAEELKQETKELEELVEDL